MRFTKKLRALWRRGQLDRDLEDELRFHREMRAHDLGDRGKALRRIGNTTALQEACRDLWTFGRVETWWQDLRYSVRNLSRSPGFCVAAIIALGLGIGADTAIFTIADGAFSWNMGFDHPDRMVIVALTDALRREEFGVSYPDFLDLRSQAKSVAGLAAYTFASVNLSDNRMFTESYHCVSMSANAFAVMEIAPVLGRGFVPDDERPGAPAVVVLTHHLWQDRYGADPLILGKTIRVNDVPTIVVGVMPSGRRSPEDTDLWVPLVPNAAMYDRANRSFAVFGRLADGSGIRRARTELASIVARLVKEYPNSDRGLTANVLPIAAITGAYNMRPVFVAMWAAVGFVLLIACADVANMLLARGAGRVREISIRLAIGAGRARIFRQLLVESLVLAFAGAFVGWLVAMAGLRWFESAIAGIARPPWLNLSLDVRAFTYLALVSAGTGILFGVAPALRLAGVNVHGALKDGGQSVAGARRVLSLSGLLVAAEMALCIVLLAGAGLMIHSAVKLYAAPVGANTDHVLSVRVNLPEAKYPAVANQTSFHGALKRRLVALPGVQDAAVVSNLPFGSFLTFPYQLEGSAVDPASAPQTGAIIADTDYFAVMQVRPRRGRVFTAADGTAGPPVVLVNEAFARKFWPGQSALGKRLRLFAGRSAEPWLTVVGVIPDILQNFHQPLDHDPLIYLPYAQQQEREMFVVARTSVPPGTLARAFRRAVQTIDANLAVYDVNSLDDYLARKRLSARVLGGVFSVFAVIALVLATVGLYAVTAHAISQRTQEIGVRMALGGTRRDILRLVLRQGLRPVAAGVAVGLPAAFGVTHVLRMVLIGVSPGDPVTFTGAILVLAAAATLASAIPARRATLLDPVVALRYE